MYCFGNSRFPAAGDCESLVLLRNLGELTSNPRNFFYIFFLWAFGLIVAITVHEFSHAYVAYRRGDDTAARLGRVSLNPIVHLDVMGTILLLAVGFGWGKPVPVNATYLRPPRRASFAMVSVAGVTANLVVAALVAMAFRLH